MFGMLKVHAVPYASLDIISNVRVAPYTVGRHLRETGVLLAHWFVRRVECFEDIHDNDCTWGRPLWPWCTVRSIRMNALCWQARPPGRRLGAVGAPCVLTDGCCVYRGESPQSLIAAEPHEILILLTSPHCGGQQGKSARTPAPSGLCSSFLVRLLLNLPLANFCKSDMMVL